MFERTTSHPTTRHRSRLRVVASSPATLLTAGLVAAGLLAGCGDSGPTEPVPDTEPVLEWVLENGPYHTLTAISGAGDVAVAVGQDGTVLRWAGSEWAEMTTVPGDIDVGAVWSAGPDTFFVADSWSRAIRRCDSSGCAAWDPPGGMSSIRDLWGTSTSDVFLVGQGGTVLHFDGQTWSAMPGSVPTFLAAIWGTGPDNVYAVGRSGIAHYDGTGWSPVPLPPGLSELSFNDVWGSGPTDVYAVADEGDIAHWDGTAWSLVDSGTDARLTGVWGTSAADVFVVGQRGYSGPDAVGTIRHFDGAGWSPLPIPDGLGALLGVWGTDSDDAWAVGEQGTILRWNGSIWSRARGGMGRDLEAVAGSSDGNVYVVGRYTLLHDDGAGWIRMMTESESWTTHSDVAFVGSDVYVTGTGGYFDLLRIRTGTLRSVDDAPLGSWRAVWGAPPDTLVLVGFRGESAYFDGTTWTPVDAGSGTTLTDVWGASGTDVWAVAGPEMYRYAGVGWGKVELDESVWLTGIWGAEADDVFAVGLEGTILHWDGTTWTRMQSGTTADLVAIRGSSPKNIYAVGFEGTVVHYDGTHWAPVELPFFLRGALLDVWLKDGTDVLVVGAGGTIVRGRR